MKTNTLLKNIKNQSKKAGLYFALVLTGALNAQVTYTFTSAGATGRFGPSQGQINTAYALTNLNGSVVATSGIQTFTIPVTGPYRIDATGASGGNMAPTSQPFGTGAQMAGDFTLTAGTVLKIVVGQKGVNTPNSNWEGGGGGGGSFVADNANVPMVIAAGGAGGDGSGNYSLRTKAGGSSITGNAGIQGAALNPLASGAGGGFTLNGQNGANSTGGQSFINGAVGGQCNYGAAVSHGGFGGGAGGDYWSIGGGAGGYQGGNTQGNYNNTDGVFAAFSYNNGANQINVSGATVTNLTQQVDGVVKIMLLCSPASAPTQTTSTQSICNNNTASLNVVNTSTINWYATLTSTTSLATGASFVTPTLSTGTYTYYAAATNTCAQGPRTAITVTVSPNPTITVNNATVCAGQSYTMVPSGASTYSYSNGSAVATPTANNTYTVTGTSTLGCSSTAISSVSVNAAPSVSVNSGAICAGQSFTMVPSGAISYSYSNGGAVATPTANASYTVTGTNTLGCTGTAISTVTVNAIPTVSASSSISGSICAGQSVSLTASGATTYSWNTGATTAVIAVSPSVTTTYTINGSSNGCSNVATITQNVNSCVGIQANATKQLAISVYPNPSNGNFTVELANGLTKVINVTDITGRIVLTASSTSDKVNVNISNLSNGIYYIKVTSDNKTEVTKVVKH